MGALVARMRRVDPLFLFLVIIPTLLSTVYYGLIASDVFISESRFVVRSAQREPQGGLGALLQGSALGRFNDDASLVHHYIASRDAMQKLDRELAIRAAFSSSDIDRLSRFPGLDFDDSSEALHRYYQKKVSIELDATGTVSILRVSAFSPQLAQQMNEQLLQLSENLVNQLNARMQRDTVRFATEEVERAETRAREAAAALAVYRNAQAVFDPDRQSALQLANIGRLQEELVAARTQLAQIRAVSPDNPQIATLRARLGALEMEVARETRKVAGGESSLTRKAAEYQTLAVQQASADRQLVAALASLEAAHAEARRQQLYLERIAAPQLADSAVEPRRVRAVLTTLVLGLAAWALAALLLAAVREHRD